MTARRRLDALEQQLGGPRQIVFECWVPVDDEREGVWLQNVRTGEVKSAAALHDSFTLQLGDCPLGEDRWPA